MIKKILINKKIDQVSTYSLNQEKLKLKFKQIVGFYFVSNYSGTGIQQLSQSLIKITLQQKYINETIPVSC